MHLENEDYIDTLNIHSDCTVINQCDRECVRRSVREAAPPFNVTYVETKERGLSKSRNMALKYASDPVCILCDNDVEYVGDYDRIINDAFATYDADIIVFFIKRPERSRPVFTRPRKMGYLSVLKIFSPEIAFRRESIAPIAFNELFGAGARFFLGEENIFLYECLKRHKKIVYVPEMIAKVRDEESTWFKGYNREFFVSRGANYEAMAGSLSILLMLQFAIRKRSLYRKSCTTVCAIRAMLDGRRQYLGLCREKK